MSGPSAPGDSTCQAARRPSAVETSPSISSCSARMTTGSRTPRRCASAGTKMASEPGQGHCRHAKNCDALHTGKRAEHRVFHSQNQTDYLDVNTHSWFVPALQPQVSNCVPLLVEKPGTSTHNPLLELTRR